MLSSINRAAIIYKLGVQKQSLRHITLPALIIGHSILHAGNDDIKYTDLNNLKKDLEFNIALSIISKNNQYFENILYRAKQDCIDKIKKERGTTNMFINTKLENVKQIQNKYNSIFSCISDELIKNKLLISNKEVEDIFRLY